MSSADNKRQRLEDDTSTSGPGGEMAEKSPTKNQSIRTGETSRVVFEEEIFSIEAQNFPEIVTLPGFVDRTLFLREFLNPRRKHTQVMIFAPTKFGKTLNLNMTDLFFDIERDTNGEAKRDVTRDPTDDELNSSESMKVFRRHSEDQSKWCKILADKEFVKKHFGRYPVVYFDFKFTAMSGKNTLYCCASRVQKAYLRHKYLRNSTEFCDEDPDIVKLKRKCQAWCFYSEDNLKQLFEEDVYGGLLNLIQSLRAHWKRDPIFLVDEIDYPTVRATMLKNVDGDEITNIGTIISKLVYKILKRDTPIVAGALITGISYLASLGLSPISNTTPHYELNHPRFSQYYGLTDDEVTGLVNKFFPESERINVLETITDWYNGYQGGGTRYCLYSLLNYINERLNPQKPGERCIFWNGGGVLADIVQTRLKKSSPLMKDINTLLSDDSIMVTCPNKICGKDLLRVFDEKQEIDRETIFSILCEIGYLAHDTEKSGRDIGEGREIWLKIPNREVRSSYYVIFEKYYFLLAPESERFDCARFFRYISPDVTKNDPEFQTQLTGFLTLLQVMFESVKCTSEASVSSLIWIVMNDGARFDQCQQNLPIKRNKKLQVITKIDLWMRRENFAVIWEFKYNGTARGDNTGEKDKTALAALEDIVPSPEGKPKQDPRSTKECKYLKAFEQYNIKNYLLVGLSVDGDHKPHMCVLANTNNWDDVIIVEH